MMIRIIVIMKMIITRHYLIHRDLSPIWKALVSNVNIHHRCKPFATAVLINHNRAEQLDFRFISVSIATYQLVALWIKNERTMNVAIFLVVVVFSLSLLHSFSSHGVSYIISVATVIVFLLSLLSSSSYHYCCASLANVAVSLLL